MTRRGGWGEDELAVLRQFYPVGGMAAVARRLPGRSSRAIHTKVSRLGLRTPSFARVLTIEPAKADEVVRLHDEEGMSFERIAEEFRVAPTTVSNTYYITKCPRLGYRPAERHPSGMLADEGRARVRLALKKGLKGVDIQLRLGVSAACVAEERRRYSADLKARGKAPLPEPGGGERYSGRRLSSAERREVEQLLRDGYGAKKIVERTGVAKTTVQRIRKALVRRLARKGEMLAGCDGSGRRTVVRESLALVHPKQRSRFRELLLAGARVAEACRQVGVGRDSGDAIRDEMIAEGCELPKPKRWNSHEPVEVGAFWPPEGKPAKIAFRRLLEAMDFDEAKEAWIADEHEKARAEAAAVRERRRSFEEQLARVSRGEVGIVPTLGRAHLEPRALA